MSIKTTNFGSKLDCAPEFFPVCGNLDQVLIMVGATQRLNLDQAKPI